MNDRDKKFFSVESIKEIIIDDVVIPGIKNLVSSVADAVLGSISDVVDIALYGEARRRTSKSRGKNRSKVSYADYYDSDRDRKSITKMNDIRDITFESRYDAESVLDSLRDILEDAEEITVADYYELTECDHTYIDQRYGWKNLANAYVSKNMRGKYFINFPKPRLLD